MNGPVYFVARIQVRALSVPAGQAREAAISLFDERRARCSFHNLELSAVLIKCCAGTK